MIRMATICSGIGAPEVASVGLNFSHQFVAEIEPFPSAVLAHHWPHVPNLGDMTKINGKEWRGKVDVLVGGTPCQAFSVAGKRESLNDERGNLTLKFVELCDAINPAYVVWENVPGVLSTADNAFGCFLGALSGNDGELFPAGDGWSNSGCVIGPRRKLAWRILDAQYFGLAQRRRRVFVVACPRDVGADPCEVLFEREGVQRHSAPSREKGEGASHDVAPCIGASGRGFERGGDTRGQDPVVAVSPTLRAGGNKTGGDRPPGTDVDTADSLIPVCFGGGPENGQIAGTVSRKWSKGSGEPAGDECYNMVACITGPITHALKAAGYAGSEDGTGRGQPVIAIQERAICENPMAGPDGVGVRTDDCAYTLEARTVPQAVAFQERGRKGGRNLEYQEDIAYALCNPGAGGRAQERCVAFEPRCARNGRGMPEEIVPPLKAQSGMTGKGDSAPCVAFESGPGWWNESDHCGTLRAEGENRPSRPSNVVRENMQVRRLTPVECERLQGFPEIEKAFEVIVWASSDRPKNCALVETKCHRSQNSAFPAEECVSQSCANVAEVNSREGQVRRRGLVPVNVRIDFVRMVLQIHSQGKSLLSVSIAEKQKWFHPHIQIEDFVHLVVEILTWSEKKALDGKAGSQRSIKHSSLLQSGRACVNLSGQEIEELVENADLFTEMVSRCMKSTILKAGQDSQMKEQNLGTLCSCVAVAIASYIPKETQAKSSYSINFSVVNGYTAIPWRNKPASECPDGPRYKALGNSMAVPCMRWILERLSA